MNTMKTLALLQEDAKADALLIDFILFLPSGSYSCMWIDPWLGAFEIRSDGYRGKAVYVRDLAHYLAIHTGKAVNATERT